MKQIIKITLALIFLYTALPNEYLKADIADSIIQGNVVWKFSEKRPVGQFANGEWWVLAPVTITKILPEYKKITDSVSLYSTEKLLTFYINGWEVNPVANQYKHGFDGALYYNINDPSKSYFDSTLVPTLPYTVTVADVANSGGAVSIVKAVSSVEKETGKNYLPYRRINSAKVLTVVSTIPEGNGAKLFRPPYVKGDKPFYSVGSIRWDRLPSYPSPVSNPPSLESIESLYSATGLGHTRAARRLLPIDAYRADYQPANGPSINEALLRLMLNDKTIEEKKRAIIAVLQRGIDIIHWQILGNVQPEDGHQPGWLAIPSFTAALLNISKYVQFVKTLPEALGNERFTSRSNFHEDCMLHSSSWNPNIVLWGGVSSEDNYWKYIITRSGNRSLLDPYGYIDGGKSSDASYQEICINAYKGEVLCAHLMPALRDVWSDSVYFKLTKYVDRMVRVGKWTQPDSCAPAEGRWRGTGPKNGSPCTSAMLSPVDGDTCILSFDNYQITFGPDPQNPGKCICDKDSSDGIGRFPHMHGSKTGWQYKSAFVDSLWNAFRIYPPDDSLILEPVGIKNLTDFNLLQNYPNPFSKLTTINYELAERSHVTIKVYDINGREIKTLVDETKAPGGYNVLFNADQLPPGVYFYRLSTGANYSVRRMMVLK